MKANWIQSTVLMGSVIFAITAGAQSSSPVSGSSSSSSGNAFEALCRVKAKESANLAFRSCMSENKSTEIENIRKEYQERLSAIKAEYEKDLGRVSGRKKQADQKQQSSAMPSKSSGKSADSDMNRIEKALMRNAILEESTSNLEDSRQESESSDMESEDQTQDNSARKAPRGKTVLSKLSANPSPGKAILYTDMTEMPEPIPVEALNGAGHP